MNLLGYTQKICKKNEIRPSRSKGQNFLVNEDIYDQIVAAADISSDDVVLEVGPGLGFLTEKLARVAKKVLAVELDDKLYKILQERLNKQGVGNVEVINADILDIVGKTHPVLQTLIPRGELKVVANLPYNITSVFLRKALSGEKKPASLTLMLQKEVAERIVAQPPKMSLLAVSVQFYANPEIVFSVPRGDFWPAPEVDSAVIKLDVRNTKLEVEEKRFFQLVKFGFSSKRKMLKNNLAAGYRISTQAAEELIKTAGFSEKIRAQELSVADWLVLSQKFNF